MRRMLPTIYFQDFLFRHADLALELELKGARFTTDATLEWHGFASSRFDAFDRLPSPAAATPVVHGTEDPIIPIRNGELLARRTPVLVWWLSRASDTYLPWSARTRLRS